MTREQWIAATPALIDLQSNIAEGEKMVTQLEGEIRDAEVAVTRQRVAAKLAGGRDRGRPTYTETQRRLAELREQLGNVLADVAAGKEALPQVRARIEAAWPVQQQADALAAKHDAAAQKFVGTLDEALAAHKRWLALRTEIASLPTQDISMPEVAPAGSPEAIETFSRCAAEIVDGLSGRAEQRQQAVREAEQRRQAARSEQLCEAAEKFKTVPEIALAREQLDDAIAQYNRCPKTLPDGRPNAVGSAGWPGRIDLATKAENANREYYRLVADMAQLVDFEPPALNLDGWFD